MSYRINDEYPGDYEAKQGILEVGRRMYAKNFVASNDGNISCKVSDNTVWCTPTGVSKGYMTDEMLVLMDLDGNVLKGSWKPSSEMKMHLRVYTENPKVKAVVHAHPPAATSYAIAGLPLNRAILTEAVMGIGEIPIAPYAMPGTQEVPDSIAPFVNSHNGCLLANHGALTWGNDVMEAWMRMESLEYYALVSMYTHGLIGQANELTCDQVDRLIERRRAPPLPQLRRGRHPRLRQMRFPGGGGRAEGAAERGVERRTRRDGRGDRAGHTDCTEYSGKREIPIKIPKSNQDSILRW